MKIDLKNLTIKKAHESLVKGDFTAVELAQAYLDEIAARNGELNAYLEVYDNVLVQAGFADKAIAALKKEGKEIPMLMGIPMAVKDNILVKGMKAGSASKILENYQATYDATVIKKLQQENGVVLLGRTNMDEFAMGGSTENSAYGVTKNPHDLSRVPGGTSGGSAAAVASDMALAALGSDTGGSIRQPSSFCGVVGLKPTYGAVSRYGLMAAVSSFDQIGPIAKTVEDAEIIFNAIRGDEDGINGNRGDGTAINTGTYKTKRVGKKKPIIGIPRSFLSMGGISPDVKKAFDSAEEKFKSLGYEIMDIELPANKYALPVYYVLNFAEVSSNMSRYDGVKYGLHKDGKDGIDDYFETRRAGLGKEVIRRILLGTYVLSSGYYDAYYNRANAVRSLITADFLKAFESVDLIITPTAPSPAFRIGEKVNDPVSMYLEDIFTVTANLTGMPAMSIPVEQGVRSLKIGERKLTPNSQLLTSNSLPIGLQLTARHGDEATLFEVGKAFEGEL